MKKFNKVAVLILSLCFLGVSNSFADMVWPAAVLEMGTLSILPITAGIVVEFFFILLLLKQSIKKTLLITIVMNLASTLIGIILIPLLGLIWEIFPGIMMYKVFKNGTFNPITWTATFIIALLYSRAGVYELNLDTLEIKKSGMPYLKNYGNVSELPDTKHITNKEWEVPPVD